MDRDIRSFNQFEWSDWYPILPPDELTVVPDESGILRISHSNVSGIHYVGHAEKGLLSRIRDLAYELRKDVMPYTDPHSAAPCLWTMKQEVGGNFFVSWNSTIPSSEVSDAKHAYLTLYRMYASQSPTANYGRMYAGYSKSSNRETGVVGQKTGEPARKQPIGPGPFDLSNIESVTEDDWLGIDWQGPVPFYFDDFGGMSYVYPNTSGMFRIWVEGNSELEAIGTTRNLSKKIPNVIPGEDKDWLVSYQYWDFPTESSRRELQSALIGAHYIATEGHVTVVHDRESEWLSLIEEGESEEVEFKRRIPESDRKKVVKDTIAISNTSGGLLFLGVTDDGDIFGLEDLQSTREQYRDLIEGNTVTGLPINVQQEILNSRSVLVVEIEPAESYPYCRDNGIFYERNGPQNVKMYGRDMEDWFDDS